MALQKKGFYKNNFRKRTQREQRINSEITHQTVRVVGEGVESKVCSIAEALDIASEVGVDLVEISRNATPPVCRVVEYQKFAYENKRKQKDKNSGSKKSELKEIRLSPNIGDHDFGFKVKQGEKFLIGGNKIKVTLRFKGRMIIHKEQGNLVMLRFAEALEESGKPESMPKLNGKSMIMFLNPKKK